MTIPMLMNKWSKIKEKVIKNISEDKFRDKSDKWWKSDQRSEKIYTNTFENRINKESDSDEQIISNLIKIIIEKKLNDESNSDEQLIKDQQRNLY